MRHRLLVFVGVLALAASAQASASARAPGKWDHLSLAQKRMVVAAAIRHDRSAIHWWLSRRAPAPPTHRALELAAVKTVWCPAIGVRAPAGVCAHGEHLRRALKTLASLDSQIRLAQTPWECRGPGVSASACAWYFDGATQCEVSHEGWFDTDTNPVYKGRFQMDSSFEQETPFGRSMENAYGRASHWPAWAQIRHAYEVWSYSGWSRWPPYYRFGCGAYHGGSYNGVAPYRVPAT